MASPATPPPAGRVRRPPPPWRAVVVTGVAALGPRLRRVTLGGEGLDGFVVDEPAASLRLLLAGDDAGLVLPTWNGNEFLLPDGRRPIIRTLTPRRWDPVARELSVDVVIHDRGAASDWARRARPGDVAGLSGPGRGYAVDPDASHFLLGGDETAIPALGQLLAAIGDRPVQTHVEVAEPGGRLEGPDGLSGVSWHVLAPGASPGSALIEAIVGAEIPSDSRLWIAGEAAAVQRLRRHLFEERGLPRGLATVRGYWKHGRGGGDGALE